MKNTEFYNALIRGIENVYRRISLIVLRKRMDAYHKQTSQNFKVFSNDIKSPLLDCIGNIIDNDQNSSQSPSNKDKNYPNVTTNLNTISKNHTSQPHEVDGSNVEELKRHYQSRTSGAWLYPEVVEKLEHSIWEHIHATIRYARQGDKDNATMHTEIANSACKELAHHMTEEHYQEFIMNIEGYLDSFKT